jgi:predicted metal-dependent hydrolase
MKKKLHDEVPALDPCYVAWFERFNACEYYEAHDVLEPLWLRTHGGDRDFFKGLIQIAGAFVHLRSQRERPRHAKDSTRLRPAARLFLRGSEHLAPYGRVHLRLDVAALRAFCESLARGIKASGFAENPWNPAKPPHLKLTA